VSATVTVVSGFSAIALAAESTHSFIPVRVTRAILSCAAASRCAATWAAACCRLGAEMTVVIWALASAGKKVSANTAAPLSRGIMLPP
jgi:hypothetical protein